MTEPTNIVSIYIEARRARDRVISDAFAFSWTFLRTLLAYTQKQPLPRMG